MNADKIINRETETPISKIVKMRKDSQFQTRINSKVKEQLKNKVGDLSKWFDKIVEKELKS